MPRPLREFRTASSDNYKEFCKVNPDSSINYKQFQDIIYAWNEMFAKHILETGSRIKIPHGLGPLTITKYKRRRYKTSKSGESIVNLPIDWKETKKQGKYIYHMNYETDGFSYYWLWDANSSYLRISKIWKLEMFRSHSRALASILKKPNDPHKLLYKQWIFR